MIMVLELGGRNARAYLPRHITRCFETHKLSPGEQITGATANKQSVLHGGPPFFFSFFFSETLL